MLPSFVGKLNTLQNLYAAENMIEELSNGVLEDHNQLLYYFLANKTLPIILFKSTYEGISRLELITLTFSHYTHTSLSGDHDKGSLKCIYQ